MYMKFYEFQEKVERIQSLAQKGATGSPKILANRMDLNERTLLRIIQGMKNQGIPIEYCRKTNTYFIKN